MERQVVNGMCGVPKKGMLVEGTNLTILKLIIGVILSSAFQRVIEADIWALPYQGHWSGIEVTAVVSDSDQTMAPGSLATDFDSCK